MRIQILLATYNGAKYIETQLESLIRQQHNAGDGYEILISDDGSTDGTAEILTEYQERYPSMISMLPSSGKGSAMKNFLYLMECSDGDVIFFCDQDDYWLPDKVSRTVAAFDDMGIPELVFSDAYIADENLKIIEVDDRSLQTYYHGELTLQKLLVQNYIMGCTMAVNRTLLDGALRSSYPGMEMHDWWLDIYAKAFGKVIHIPNKLMKYRQHGDNEVGAKDLNSGKYIRSHLNGRAIRTNCGNLLKQAAGFYNCYGEKMSPEVSRIFTDFIGLRDRNKLSRIYTQIHEGYLKSTPARVIGQLIYM